MINKIAEKGAAYTGDTSNNQHDVRIPASIKYDGISQPIRQLF